MHEYLDSALIKMASDDAYDCDLRGSEFEQAFEFIDAALSDSAFKRWNGTVFQGKFLMSVFEVISKGVSENLGHLREMPPEERNNFIVTTAKRLWENEVFRKNSGAGVRGTTRLSKLLPLAADMFKP